MNQRDVLRRVRWWTVEPEPDGDGWIVTNGRQRERFAPGRDLEAQARADHLNHIGAQP